MLLKNQVLEHKPTGNRWRVLDMDGESQTVWLFNMTDAKAVPKGIAASTLHTSDELVEVEPPRNVTKLKPSEAAIRRRDEAYACIEPLVATMDIFVPALRSAMVAARALELQCSPQTIYKYLRAWWRNGQNRQALTPGFDRSGNVAGDTSGRGRPSKYGAATYQITARDQSLIEQILKTTFLKTETLTLAATYQTLLEQHYSYIDAEGRRILNLPGERPSIAQFRWHARKASTCRVGYPLPQRQRRI
jgi:putative transposase